MLSGVYSAATALRTAEFQQDVLATNLAHMNVPGFRRASVAVETFAAELEAQAEGEPGYGNTAASLVTDFTPGPVVNTGRTLDLAIQGEGFFAVQGTDGPLYTRNGVLQVSGNRQLVGTHGMPFLGENGPLTVPVGITPSQINVAQDGTVYADGQQFGQLRLVRFADNAALTQVGTTLFSAANANPDPREVWVQQGMREQSNVVPIDELVTMIVAMRYHEAAQRVLTSIDDAVAQQTNPGG